jgi:hypothetical protein
MGGLSKYVRERRALDLNKWRNYESRIGTVYYDRTKGDSRELREQLGLKLLGLKLVVS